MAIGDYEVRPFAGPVGKPVPPEQVRGNDETLRTAFNSHQSDVVAHITSGNAADRPASGTTGQIYLAIDTAALSFWDGSAWQAL